MANVYKDILLDETGDLQIRDGDFVIGNSLNQEVESVLTLHQGELKQYPLLGPNLTSMLKTTKKEEIKRRLKLHLELDNKQIGVIKLDNGAINIDATNK